MSEFVENVDEDYEFSIWTKSGHMLKVEPEDSSWHGDPVILAQNLSRKYDCKITVKKITQVTVTP